jgi:hypothetical protein
MVRFKNTAKMKWYLYRSDAKLCVGLVAAHKGAPGRLRLRGILKRRRASVAALRERSMAVWGIVLIAFGTLYLIKPDIFQRWFWKRTAISQRLLTPEKNKVYMRILGSVFIVVGIVLLVFFRQ